MAKTKKKAPEKKFKYKNADKQKGIYLVSRKSIERQIKNCTTSEFKIYEPSDFDAGLW